jgi:hypothetical protein
MPTNTTTIDQVSVSNKANVDKLKAEARSEVVKPETVNAPVAPVIPD